MTMKMKILYSAVAVLVIVAISGANALTCYSCHTGHEGCADPFNNTNIPTVNCSALYYSSRADELGIRAASDEPLNEDYSRASDTDQYECYAYHRNFPLNYTEVVRGCRVIDSDLCGLIVNSSVGAGVNVSNCYTCREDYCNEAQTLNSAVMLILLSAALTLVASKF